MRNSVILLVSIRFVLLVLAQVVLFNHINFYGYINPLVYVLFFYWYPIRVNRTVFILVSFAFGLCLDVFSDTMALHTITSLTMAYTRPLIMRFCFGAIYEMQGFTFNNTTRIQRITFLLLLILLQHTLFFSLEMLSFSHFLLILRKILFTGLFTLVICILLSSLFGPAKES